MAFVDFNTVLVPIYQALSVDAVLMQSNYLNGAGKVHISPTRPQSAVNPCLALRLRAVPTPEGENETFLFRWLLELVLYVDNFTAPEPDGTRAAAIDARIYALLHRKSFSNGTVSIETMLENNFGTQLTDPATPGESFWISRYNVMAL